MIPIPHGRLSQLYQYLDKGNVRIDFGLLSTTVQRNQEGASQKGSNQHVTLRSQSRFTEPDLLIMTLSQTARLGVKELVPKKKNKIELA